jgi:hypothetical protein
MFNGIGISPAIAGGGVSYNPAVLFGGGTEGIWIDPSDTSTMFKDVAGTQPVTADGDAVALIKDKSGRGHDLSQATAAQRPLYKTAVGLSWLQFDGVDDNLTGTLPIAQLGGNLSKTTILADRPADIAAGHTLFIYGSQVGSRAFGVTEDGTGITLFEWGADLLAAGQSSAADKVITGIRNGTLLSIRKNAVVVAGPTDEGATLIDTNTLTVGQLPGLNQYSGRIYGLMIVAGTPDPTFAEKWLGTKAGLAL